MYWNAYSGSETHPFLIGTLTLFLFYTTWTLMAFWMKTYDHAENKKLLGIQLNFVIKIVYMKWNYNFTFSEKEHLTK